MSDKTSSRRKFLKVVPAVVAGAVASSRVLAQGRGGQPTGPVTPDMIKAAETIDGVKFTSEEETAIARNANANLNQINRLRQKIDRRNIARIVHAERDADHEPRR